MEIKEALKEVKSGKFRPVYVLFGKDRYRMEQFIEMLADTMFTADEKEMGIARYDTSETPVEEMVLEAETLPFFAARKLIVVRDVSVMAAGGKDQSKLEHRPETVLQYMEHPMETSVIVFAVYADKLDERRKLVKALKERGSLIAFPELDGPQLVQWMAKRASQQERTMSAEAAELLLSRIGHHMQQLSQEVDKLCLHVGIGGMITEELVRDLTSSTVEEDVFALVDAIADMSIQRALPLYRNLLIRREEPIKIAALIARQLRIMLGIKELEGQYSPQQMAGQLGLHPYAVKLAAEKARKYNVNRLGKLLGSIADLDYAMKTGRIDKSLGMELYLLSLGTEKEMTYGA
ncbi:DNA polymerase III subunit delta [Paenibacillus sp. J5C_2022]|uniref:DNA polymerase III subunit delta n=1 Tax=Paenibacillus sp. J5C2022 TaxID=2977129 RepID=UPI0021CF89F0|nr:DNA polymerase III subunit delta [Paenibacillus sp. J5C2022]MCU6707642.1 DNA polymerase III subunit delta [Paenibacillus sp. J5C2022]